MRRRPSCTARTALAALALFSFGAPLARAQRILVPHDRPRALVALVDVRAGALVDSEWLDVEGTAIPTPGSNVLTCVERIGDEVWVGGALHIWRYDATTREFMDSFEVGAPVRAIDRQSRRVVVTTSDTIILFDFSGKPIGRINVVGAGDTLELRGSMLIAIRGESRVDRYTFDGQRIGTFAGPTIPSPLGVLSNPRQLALRQNGNVLVCGDVRVYEFREDGTFLAEYDVGPFEGGVAETQSGRLFVPLGDGVAIHDAVSNATTRIGALPFGQGRTASLFDSGRPNVVAPGEASSETTCSGGRNSTGWAARAGVVGSAEVSDRILSVLGERLPPGAPTFVLLGPDVARIQRLGGTLCLSPGTLSVVPEAAIASERGQVLVPIVRGAQALAQFPPGSTWHVQLLYRDTDRLRVSDAVRVTFAE